MRCVSVDTDLELWQLVTSHDLFAARWQQCSQLSIVTNFSFVSFLLSLLYASCIVRYYYCNTSASQLTQSLWTL